MYCTDRICDSKSLKVKNKDHTAKILDKNSQQFEINEINNIEATFKFYSSPNDQYISYGSCYRTIEELGLLKNKKYLINVSASAFYAKQLPVEFYAHCEWTIKEL